MVSHAIPITVLDEAGGHVHHLQHYAGRIAGLKPFDGGHVARSFSWEEQVWTGNITSAIESERVRNKTLSNSFRRKHSQEIQRDDETSLSMSSDIHPDDGPAENNRGSQEILDPRAGDQIIAILGTNSHNSSEPNNPWNASHYGELASITADKIITSSTYKSSSRQSYS